MELKETNKTKEINEAPSKELIIKVSDSGIEKSRAEEIEAVFVPMVAMLKEFEKGYDEVIKRAEEGITNEVVSVAKRIRLDIGKIRIRADKVRKEQKESLVREGKAIEGVSNILKFAVVEKEKKLQEIETHFETIEKERIAKIQIDREDEIMQYVEGDERLRFPDLVTMPDNVWVNYLNGYKLTHEKKIEAEKKAEEDRIKAEKEAEAKKIEDEKIRKEQERKLKEENERLKLEAEQREKEHQKQIEAEKKIREEEAEQDRIEKEKREKADKIEEAKRVKEKSEQDEILKKEREAREKAEAEKLKAEQDAKQKQEVEKKLRLENEAKEKAKNDAILLEEKKKREKIQAELDEKEAEEKEAADKKEAAKKQELLAPDKDKLTKLSKDIQMVFIPMVKNAGAQGILKIVRDRLEKTYIDLINEIGKL